MLNFRRSANN